MTKRQNTFGFICFLIGILAGMEIAGNLDVLVRLVITVAILLLCVYLVLPYHEGHEPAGVLRNVYRQGIGRGSHRELGCWTSTSQIQISSTIIRESH